MEDPVPIIPAEAIPMLSWLFSDPLAVGAQAPDFTASDQDGKPLTLSSFRGKNVVLVFYPMDETPTCTTQLCEFRDEWAEVEKRNTAVLGVNPGSAEKHRKFRNVKALPFPLLVDEGKKIANLYNAGGLIIRRTVYLIGKDGRIRYARRGKPLPSEVLAAAEQ
jgi:thioredoxin-dependent peroxiredoxin